MALSLPQRYAVLIPERVSSAARAASLDRIRGLAIACMVVDHACIVWAGPDWLRLTVGRVAMPLFFVLGGHLVRRITGRHSLILLAGLVLPFAVPWIDGVNVLVWYGLGAALIVGLRRLHLPVWLLPLAALAWSANFGSWSPLHAVIAPAHDAFDGLGLLGLMGLGAVLDRSAFGWGEKLPALFGRVGRYPMTAYLGHLFLLQGLVLLGVTVLH
jgi:hypothetical protein